MGCENSELKEQGYTGEALGTTYQIKFFYSQELELNKALDSIFAVMNSSMSTYQADSDISRINSGDSTVTVDENFQEVFQLSNKIYIESDGYFDPTVGKIVNAFGFGPEKGQENVDQEKIDSLLTYVGFNKLKLKVDHRIQKQYPGIYIDFNAIAKGYAVDVVARYLDQKNVRDYLIEIGGELVAKGINRAKDQVWVVGIDDPLQAAGERSLQAAVKLKNRGMATSGNYRKFREDPVTGRAFVHTINPLTGLAERSNLLSASVLAKNCALADGYATAFMAMGLGKSKELVDKLENVDVLLIYAEGNGVKVFKTEGFEKALLSN
jgi:thiamine biosynthesis lipoprotein